MAEQLFSKMLGSQEGNRVEVVAESSGSRGRFSLFSESNEYWGGPEELDELIDALQKAREELAKQEG